MSLSVGENLAESFNFAKDGLIGHWVRWLLLAIIGAIPIVDFIFLGYAVKVLKGGNVAPELDGWGKLFIDGIKLFFLVIAYLLIPIIVIIAGIFMGGLMGGIGTIITILGFILALAFGIAAPMAAVRFSKTDSLGEGFNFSEIFKRIKSIGWGKYILSYAVLVIVLLLFCALIAILDIMLTEWLQIGLILPIIIIPFLLLWKGKFYENLYSRE